MLKVNSVFFSIQGEGKDTGIPTLFVRLSGCSMGCEFCDEGGDKLSYEYVTTDRLFTHVLSILEDTVGNVTNIVFTGGEPMEQDISKIVKKLRRQGLRIGLETNGTRPLDELEFYFNSVSLSPKINRSKCKISQATSLKILYPYVYGATAEEYSDFDAEYKCIQPIWGKTTPDEILNVVAALGPPWRVGFQVHKLVELD